MDAIIEVSGLRKTYGAFVAVDDVSFEVRQGEIFGILGPNGAGKTTIVESIAGLRRPDGGHIRVAGLDPRQDGRRLREVVGVQLQQAALPERLKVWEALDLFASFYEHPADWERLPVSGALTASATQCSPACRAASARGCSSRSRWSATPRSSSWTS